MSTVFLGVGVVDVGVVGVGVVGVAVTSDFDRGGLLTAFLTVQDSGIGGTGRTEQGEYPKCHPETHTHGGFM